jgi:small ligand-binding sensory domain FIST
MSPLPRSMTMPQTSTGLRFASALSTEPDTAAAMDEVIATLTSALGGPADLVVVFATPHHAEGFGLIDELLGATLSPHVVMGVTAEGVIGVRHEVEGGPGLSVLAASLPGAMLQPFTLGGTDPQEGVSHAGALRAAVTGDAMAGAEPKAVLLFGDPFSSPMNNLLPGFGEAFPGTPVLGGMASAARQPDGNRLLLEGRVRTRGAIGLALAGDIDVQTTVSQGCRPIGKPYVITKSKRHIVMELGGVRAFDALQQMAAALGDEDRLLIQQNGLMVGRVINEYKDRFGRGDFLIRGLLGVDPQQGYFAIADPQVRVGQTIQFHVRDQKTAQEDFSLLLEAQKLHTPGSDAGGEGASGGGGTSGGGGALLFSCNGRGTRLFSHKHADANMIHHALGDIPLAGFFAAGEIGPVGDQNFLHGHTASLVVIRAKSDPS